MGAAIVSLVLTAISMRYFVQALDLDWYEDESGLITAFLIWFFGVMAFGNIFLAKYINAQGSFGFRDYLSKSFAFYTFLFLVAYVLAVVIAAFLTDGDIILFKFQDLQGLLVGPAILLGLVLTYNLVPFFLFVLFNFCLIKLYLKERAKKCQN